MIKKFIIKPLLSLIAIASIFFLMSYISNQIEDYKKDAASYVVRWIKENKGWQTEIGEVKLSLPLQIHIDHVTISEGKDSILKIDQLILSINPIELLRKHAVFTAIQMQSLTLSEKAVRSNSLSKQSSQSNLIEASLPKQFKVNHLQIARLFVDQNLFSDAYVNLKSLQFPISVSGNLAINLNENSGFADMTLASLLNAKNALHIVTTLTQNSEQLNFQTRLILSDSQSLADLIPIPNNLLSHSYSLQSYIEASASAETWKKMIDLKNLEQNEELKGSFQLNYSLKDVSAQFDPMLESYGSFKGSFISSAEKKLTISNITCLIGSNALEGTLSLNNDNMLNGTTFLMNTQDLSFLDSPVKNFGNLKIECAFSGPFAAPEMNLKLFNPALEIGKECFENSSAELNFTYAHNKFIGSIRLQSFLTAGPINLFSNFEWIGNNQLTLANLQVEAPQIQLKGSLQAALPDKIILGNLEGKTDLALVHHLIAGRLDQNLAGSLSFNAYFQKSEHDANTTVHLLLNSDQVQLGDMIAKGASVTVNGTFPEWEGTLKITSKQLSWDKCLASDVSGETTISHQTMEWPFSLSFTQEKFGKLHLQAQGHWHSTSDISVVTFDTMEGSLAEHQLFLQNAFTFRRNRDSFALTPITFSLDKGIIHTVFNHSFDGSQAKFEAENLPLNVLYLINPDFPLLTGAFSCAAVFSETPAEISGEIALEIHNFKFLVEPIATPEFMHGAFTAKLSGHTLTCQGDVKGLSPQPINMTANLPVTIALSPPVFEIHPNKDFDAHLELHGPIGAFLELFMTGNATNISGQTHVFLDATGTLAAPEINGKGEISEGSFELLELGTSLKNAKAILSLKGSTATLTEFTATDGKSGIVTGTGTAELDMQKKFPFSLLLEVNKAALLNMDYIFGFASGQLTFEGNMEKGLLKGKLVTDSLVINLPDQVNDLAEAMEITYINQSENQVKPTEYMKEKSTWPLTFDLDIQMPGRGFINGSNLNSEWKGAVAMTGSNDLPLFNGSCQIIRGEYNINGKPFEIKQGSITFAGDIEKKTSFYVIASKDIEEIKADIIVKGNLKSPAISFRSNPPLPQRDILSWILFNRGASEITAFQGTQLNESITNLPTESSEPDLLTKIRNRIGIDRIDINRHDSKGSSNEVSVQVGKYLSKGIFVSVNKSVTAEANRLAIEANLIKNFKIQAEVGDDSDAQLQLKWKHDY